MSNNNGYVFRFVEMRQAASEVKEIASRYLSAANTFETDYLAAIQDWEGASKDKMQAFIQGTVKEYTGESVPKLLNALAELLEANADQMEKADQQISDSIPN